MTIKELKEIINDIDEKYNNENIITDNKDYILNIAWEAL